MGSIDVRVSKGTSAVGMSQGEQAPTGEQGKPSVSSQAVNTAVINVGKQLLSQGIKQYGNITGDYLVQESIDNALGLTADVLTIAKGGALGALYVGTRYITSMWASSVSQDRAYRDLEMSRERAGKIYVSGGR